MNGIPAQMIFSPQSCSLELLDKTLTPEYRKLAERILAQVEKSVNTHTSHHNLIIGPRGSGKTHVITYIKKRLEEKYSKDHLLNLIPLSEQGEGIKNMLDFFLACFHAAGISSKDVAGRINSKSKPLAKDSAIELFNEITGKRPTLIIMENLSGIFDHLQESAITQLRGFLQENPFITLLASSTGLLTKGSIPDHPFYGFFNIHPLKELDLNATGSYLLALAKAEGKKGLSHALKEAQARSSLNAIYDLTGGNHRLLAMLSGHLLAENLLKPEDPFIRMADRELTPYYMQKLDRLSPQQNRLLRIIAGQNGRALNVNEIAGFTFLTPSTVSRQLYDLLHAGYVQRNQIGRESFYEIKDPLLRFVLDIKEGRVQTLPLIVSFLKNWYEVQGLPKTEISKQTAFEHIDKFISGESDEDEFKRQVSQYKEDKDAITRGLIFWLKENIPLLKHRASMLKSAYEALVPALSEMPHTAPALQMLNAICQYSLDDQKALLGLPLEIRRFAESMLRGGL